MSAHRVVPLLGLVAFLCLHTDAALANSKCKLRHYSHKAMQTDMNGRRCWDEVKMMSCWGYCLSYEVRVLYLVQPHCV